MCSRPHRQPLTKTGSHILLIFQIMARFSILLNFRKLTPFQVSPVISGSSQTSSLVNLFLLQLPWASVLLIFSAPAPTCRASACKATCGVFAKAEVFPGSLSITRTQPTPRVLTPNAPKEQDSWTPPCSLVLWRGDKWPPLALSHLSPNTQSLSESL